MLDLTPRQFELLKIFYEHRQGINLGSSDPDNQFNGRVHGNLLRKLHTKRLIRMYHKTEIVDGVKYYPRIVEWTPAGLQYCKELFPEPRKQKSPRE